MNRKQEEMKTVGLLGIIKDSYKLLLRGRRIFSKIIFSLVLPFALLTLFHAKIVNFFFPIDDDYILRLNAAASAFNNKASSGVWRNDTQSFKDDSLDFLSSFMSFKLAYLLLFELVYAAVSMLAKMTFTAAAVDVTARMYAAKDVSFGKTMRVVSRVWKRLLVTYLCPVAFIVVSSLVFGLLLVISLVRMGFRGQPISSVVELFGLVVLFVISMEYMAIIFHLADVVTVLEDACGLKAVRKSMSLISGKLGLAIAIFIVEKFAIDPVKGMVPLLLRSEKFAAEVLVGVAVWVMALLEVIEVVAITIFYAICKSHHQETLDTVEFLGTKDVDSEYMPLKCSSD